MIYTYWNITRGKQYMLKPFFLKQLLSFALVFYKIVVTYGHIKSKLPYA